MSEKQQIAALADKLDLLINQYRHEFDLTYASVVGVLTIKIQLLCQEADDHSHGSDLGGSA